MEDSVSNIFLSYSRKDKGIVERLENRLEAAGHSVWVDIEDIRGGDQWRRAIAEAIRQADTFLLLLSSNAVKSDNVCKELNLAEETKTRVIPVAISSVAIPPEMQYQLAGVQRIDLATDFEAGLKQLLEALGGSDVPVAGQPTVSTSIQGSSSPAAPVRKQGKGPWLWISLLAIALMVAVGAIWIGRNDDAPVVNQATTAVALIDTPVPSTDTPTPIPPTDIPTPTKIPEPPTHTSIPPTEIPPNPPAAMVTATPSKTPNPIPTLKRVTMNLTAKELGQEKFYAIARAFEAGDYEKLRIVVEKKTKRYPTNPDIVVIQGYEFPAGVYKVAGGILAVTEQAGYAVEFRYGEVDTVNLAQQAAQDFLAGKISYEEYEKKITEYFYIPFQNGKMEVAIQQ